MPWKCRRMDQALKLGMQWVKTATTFVMLWQTWWLLVLWILCALSSMYHRSQGQMCEGSIKNPYSLVDVLTAWSPSPPAQEQRGWGAKTWSDWGVQKAFFSRLRSTTITVFFTCNMYSNVYFEGIKLSKRVTFIYSHTMDIWLLLHFKRV